MVSAMVQKTWACIAVGAAGWAGFAGCSGEDAAPFDLPVLETTYALFGTAAAGRPLRPSAVQVVDLQAGAPALRPDFIAGGDIDVVWAGLDPVDLPSGLTPDALTFVRGDERGTRGLPPLATPHVLRAPSAPEAPDALVPVEQPSLSRSVREDRENRLNTMLSDLAIPRACRAPSTPWQVHTPVISPDTVVNARAMSDGTTVLGLTATSTAMIGVLAPNGRDVALIGVGVDDYVQLSERATVRGLDGQEVVHPSGALVPSTLSIGVEAGFGGRGSAWFYDRGQWRRDVDLDAVLPRVVRGLQRVNVDGVASVCAYGVGQGSQRPATVWCRPAAGGDWSTLATFDARFGMTTLVELTDDSLLAVDFGATVYRRPSGADSWTISAEALVNVGCQPLCATIPRVASASGAVGDPNGFWVAGDNGEVLELSVAGGEVEVSTPAGVDDALFGDERRAATEPINFLATAISPDGALWLATDRGVLLRRDVSGRFERVCMPDAFDGVVVGALAVHSDGRLIMSGNPVIVAQSTWMTP